MQPGLKFTNHYIRELGDAGVALPPEPLNDAVCVITSGDAAQLIGLPATNEADPLWTELFSGHKTIPGSQPFSQVYAGHQFGSYVPRLGDGRGLLLGQVLNPNGLLLGQVLNPNGQLWDLHLKGAGRTPYSRQGDGRAVLRSCIREFLASEALHHLGIPTSRALCILAGSEPVYREKVEQRASMVRLAQSHIRFGHFEYFFYRDDIPLLKRLCDYCLKHHFSKCQTATNPLAAMFTEIVKHTARMIAHWQAYGFCHGVMNTDNMSILGDTFDYGPYGFLDDYDAGHICNHSDHSGRYIFARQPDIGFWNLQCLAQALSPLLTKDKLEQALLQYEPELLQQYSQLMAKRFGLEKMPQGTGGQLNQFIELLQQQKVDHTLAFTHLTEAVAGDPQPLQSLFSAPQQLTSWLNEYLELIARHSNQADSLAAMQTSNPSLILRNYMAQEVIEAAEQGDAQPLKVLHEALRTPFTPHDPNNRWQQPAPQWGKELAISCSS